MNSAVRRVAVLLVTILAAVLPVLSVETAFVEYDIDGTTKYVDVTWNKESGSTEQEQLKLPVHESFRAAVGSLAYVSAQKATVYGAVPLGLGHSELLGDGVAGTVHVVVHINWRKAGEATADAPYGIAKVSAKVE